LPQQFGAKSRPGNGEAGLQDPEIANALVPGAVTSPWVNAEAAINHVRKKYGGLWVGGKVVAMPDGIRFTPNGMNRVLHVGLESTDIPLDTITSVHREFGWLTGIVVVKPAEGECRGATSGASR
jgi:hypothetical protein